MTVWVAIKARNVITEEDNMFNVKTPQKWMLLSGILFCIAECLAENHPVFDYGTIESAGIAMPYRYVSLNEIDSGKPALVIYLHGGSSKGEDNEAQMLEAGIDSITNYLTEKKTPAFFLVPQCPADKSWGGPMLGVLKALIEEFKEGKVGDGRIYILGGSMGGTGTWSMVSAYPGLFAAAMPVAGNPSKCVVENVAQTPVYTVMGTEDKIMNVETTSDFIDELNFLGGIARLDIEEGWTHEETCIQSYTAGRLDWIFGHNRNPSGIGNPTTDYKIVESVRYYSLDGRSLAEPPCKGFYIERSRYNDGAIATVKVMK